MSQPFASSPLPDGCISDLQFDKWQAAELSRQIEQQLELHVAGCARCSRRRQRLADDVARFLQQFPTPPAAVTPPTALANKRRYLLAAASTALAAAAALVLWLRMPAGDLGTRSKGTAQLSFFVKHAGQVTPGLPGQRVFAGDQLRFSVTASKPRHLAILGSDSTGATFVYHSASARSVAIDAGRDVALPSSVEFDAAPGTETIWAIFCDEAFAVGPLQAKLAAQGTLQEPPGCSMETLRLVKGSPP
jgi:Domain of unknown function (DUF4384)